MKNTKIKILLGGVVLLIFANFFIWKAIFSLGSGHLEVTFFDVKQGDSIFLEMPQGHQILIDGGASGDRILEKLSNELPFYDRTLDMIILTHPDYDHLRGLLDVLDRYEVENILWTGVLRETKTFEKWLEKLEKEKANIIIAQKGQSIKVGGAQFFILYPLKNLEGTLWEKNSNDGSIVTKLLFGENTFLFTGDISKKVEPDLLATEDNLSAEILKVAHHGSKNSSSKEFLGMVNPEIAVISCGKDNNYGHPHQETLSNLEELNTDILRTDEMGDIKIIAGL